jgi:hypothetical protein
MKWLAWGSGAVVAAALIACGASANAPDDGTESKGGGNGDASIYDGGTDYVTDSGEGDETGSGCGDTTSPRNCGSCGNVCAGLDASADNVRCTEEAGAAQCFFSCQGEHYDIDQDASDGCEKVDSPLENHSVATATNLGSVGCNDGDSAQNLSGILPSDDRVHEDPGVIGFDSATGAAPDYWTIVGSGGTFCQDDLNLTLTVTGSSNATCYMLNATTSSGDGPYSCAITSGTSCSILNGSGSYSDGDTINWWVSRTCTAATPEAPTYTITGHL